MPTLLIDLEKLIADSGLPVREVARRAGLDAWRLEHLLRKDIPHTEFNRYMEVLGSVLAVIQAERPELVEPLTKPFSLTEKDIP